jgi:hypothetical protein
MIGAWQGITLQDLMRVSNAIHGVGDAATAHVARQMFHAGIQPDEEDAGRLARSRWLERNRAESSFPCGVVPRPEPGPGEPVLNVLPEMKRAIASIIAAVLPTDLVFLLEQDSTEIVELGRLPRGSIQATDVVDEAGVHLPEPLHETFETDQPAMTVLRWSNDGVDDEERFAFRSVWLAWKAARKLAAARQG